MKQYLIIVFIFLTHNTVAQLSCNFFLNDACTSSLDSVEWEIIDDERNIFKSNQFFELNSNIEYFVSG